MKNYVDLLNLKFMTKLINYLGSTGNDKDFSEEGIIFESKKYNVSKKGTSIKVECSDGRSIAVIIVINETSYGSREKFYYYNTKVKYVFPSGNIIFINKSFKKKINDLSFFQEGQFTYKDLIEDSEFYYINNEDKVCHQLTWNEEEKRFNYEYGLERQKDGYVYFSGIDKYLISKDLNYIKAFNGKTLPNKEDLEKFNVENEKTLFNNLLENIEFHQFSKEMILELVERLKDKKDLANKILDAYERTIIPKCEEILSQETKVDQEIANNVFSDRELVFVLEALKEISCYRNTLKQEKDINSLSLERQKSLIIQFNNNKNFKNIIR